MELRYDCYGYHKEKELFMKVSFNSPWIRQQLGDLIRGGIAGTRFRLVFYTLLNIRVTYQFLKVVV